MSLRSLRAEIEKRSKAIVDLEGLKPNPGNQTLAYYCPADELFYGGQPYGGKSFLIILLALTAHRRSLILRKRALDLSAIKSEFHKLTGVSIGYEATINDRLIQVGGCKDEGSKYKYQGQPHDLKAFDEITQFTKSAYQYIKTWNRTDRPGQRCRVVCSFNPPTSPAQMWVLDYLRPWLDKAHKNPAVSGEVRYFIGDDEVDSPEPVEINGRVVHPLSRCFILSSAEDNPLLRETGYDRILSNLPHDLAALMDFDEAMNDDPWQVIPMRWVLAAQERWRRRQHEPRPPLSCIAGDIARGGGDETVRACRYVDLIDVVTKPGKETSTGQLSASFLLEAIAGFPGTPIHVDGIGVGGSTVDRLRELGQNVVDVQAAGASHARTSSGAYGFINIRAEMIWKLREALDPESGLNLALPDHPDLIGDLCSPKWWLTQRGIQVESKDKVKERLGRSPGVGDAVAMANWIGAVSLSPDCF